VPRFTTDRTETPATTNPLGVKGVGEAGAIASPPAVVNAILDAVRHLGVTDIDMPCSPQRVWRAVQSARGAVKSTSEHATETAAGGGLGSIDAQQGGAE
jgi:aerobic carbon-monoxide dehydrogenase large subunit